MCPFLSRTLQFIEQVSVFRSVTALILHFHRVVTLTLVRDLGLTESIYGLFKIVKNNNQCIQSKGVNKPNTVYLIGVNRLPCPNLPFSGETD